MSNKIPESAIIEWRDIVPWSEDAQKDFRAIAWTQPNYVLIFHSVRSYNKRASLPAGMFFH
ncbi:hypothetical protein AGMMS49574_23860 [Bacteroidia bacterium]|nr:hypothetical protein AGMMS49574_23860 [Bacteroidia bacterium]